MRHIILKDTKISTKDFETWKKEDIKFWEEYLGITPTYTVLDQDYSSYPTYIDQDGDIRPTEAYLKGLNTRVVSEYGEFGCDFILLMVHEDHWLSDTTPDIKGDGIWGTNYSYTFGKQCLDYCRWDKDNTANTFGTAYHERHHSFDAIIKVELGIDIAPMLNVTKYDHEITHGNNLAWKYIRHKENTESLRIMKPYLVQAFEKRKEKHSERIKGLMQTVVNLSSQLVYLLRVQKAKKNGIPRA